MNVPVLCRLYSACLKLASGSIGGVQRTHEESWIDFVFEPTLRALISTLASTISLSTEVQAKCRRSVFNERAPDHHEMARFNKTTFYKRLKGQTGAPHSSFELDHGG